MMLLKKTGNVLCRNHIGSQRCMSGFGDMLRQTVAQNKASVESSETASNQNKPESEVPVINSEMELQPEWASLERRVLGRKTLKTGPQGRTSLRKGSAWDAENI